MAANDKKVEYQISADPTGFEAGMARTAAAARAAQGQIESHFSKVGDSINAVQGKLLAMAAILAGGAAFKAQVDESIKWTGEANKLGKALGITATEASVLNVALGDVYSDADTMVAASNKMAKALGENEDKFKALGIQTRDTKGNFRPMLEIILDTNARLLQFKEGTDRNVEGIKLYGKAWGEMQPILKLTKELMDESKKKAEELRLVVGEESVRDAARYKAAMNDVGDVMGAVKKVVGDAVIPILTELGQEFAETGPQRVMVMVNVMKILVAVFEAVRIAVTIVWESIKATVASAVNSVMMWVEIASKAMAGDWEGAKAAYKRGMDSQVAIVEDGIKSIVDRYEKARMKIADLMEGAGPTATKAKPDLERSKPPPAAAGTAVKDTRFQDWKSVLEERKIAEKQFFKESLSEDLAYWEEKLTHVRGTSDKENQIRRQIKHEMFTIEKQLAQQGAAEEMAQLNFRKEQLRGNADAQLEIEKQKAARIGELYGLQSHQYIEALREVERAKYASDEQLRHIDEMRIETEKRSALTALDMKREGYRMQLELGQINAAEEIAALRQLKEQEYQIERKALEDKLALIREDVAARRAAKDEIRALDEKHAVDMKKSVDDEVLANRKRWEQMTSPIVSAFDTAVKGIILGTTTWKKAFSSITQSILGEFINLGVKMVARWALNQFALTAATVAGIAERSAAEEGASGASLALQGGEILKKIVNFAAETFAGIFAFLSGLMGPAAIGPAAAGAATVNAIAGTVVMGASAAGGYDIPAGVNPKTQLHAREMVLPAHLADAVRAMAGGGGGGGGSLPPIHIHAMDSRDVLRALQSGGALHKAVRELNRNFAPAR